MNYQTIGEFTSYLKLMFDNSTKMRNVYLKGEISNFKRHPTGHLYFSLKDEKSKINAIMFARDTFNLKFNPTDGTKVLVHGRVSIYEQAGNYQIYVDEMEEDGIGNLYKKYEELKKKLELEGLFDQEHKKVIPFFPKRVGVITAKTGAAIRDIVTTIKRRCPITEIIVFSSLVQGDGAKEDIVRNIHLAENYNIDTLIVGRGGGSIEDLWPFNEEIVARAIYKCNIPIISAVGHETDFTIADFVADARAATPTAGAMIATPVLTDLIKHNDQLKIRLNETILKKIKIFNLELDRFKNSYILKNPMIMYDNKKQKLIMYSDKLNGLINNIIINKKNKLNILHNNHIIINPLTLYNDKIKYLDKLNEKLLVINPLNTLKRGYSVLYKDNSTINSIKKLKINDKIKIKLVDGLVDASIDKMEEEK
ncbi:exodeoxyribonuclease 7 large subunit [Firmicutes bacterium CAG:884]|nr:exodeoxyribonuclease 7 large subunit [Firmicutes bacterium CAG:884]